MRKQTLAVQRMQDYIEQNKTMEITLSDPVYILIRNRINSPIPGRATRSIH